MANIVGDDFEKAQFQAITSLRTYAEIRKHKETSIFVIVLRVL